MKTTDFRNLLRYWPIIPFVILLYCIGHIGYRIYDPGQSFPPTPAIVGTIPSPSTKIVANSLKTIFSVLFGLALSEAFKQFVAESKGLDLESPMPIHWGRLPALFSFLCLLAPFYQGTLEYFDRLYLLKATDFHVENSPDIIVFVIEGMLFFVMSRALSPGRYVLFYTTATLLLTINIVWLSHWGGFWTGSKTSEDPQASAVLRNCLSINGYAVCALFSVYSLFKCWEESDLTWQKSDAVSRLGLEDARKLADVVNKHTELSRIVADARQLQMVLEACKLVTEKAGITKVIQLSDAIYIKAKELQINPEIGLWLKLKAESKELKDILTPMIPTAIRSESRMSFLRSLTMEWKEISQAVNFNSVRRAAYVAMIILIMRTIADYRLNSFFYFASN